MFSFFFGCTTLLISLALFVQGTTVQQKTSAPVKEEDDGGDVDDIDLFGSDEDEEAEKLKEQRLKEYAAKKAKKPTLIAKSSILLDVKPVRVFVHSKNRVTLCSSLILWW